MYELPISDLLDSRSYSHQRLSVYKANPNWDFQLHSISFLGWKVLSIVILLNGSRISSDQDSCYLSVKVVINNYFVLLYCKWFREIYSCYLLSLGYLIRLLSFHRFKKRFILILHEEAKFMVLEVWTRDICTDIMLALQHPITTMGSQELTNPNTMYKIS